MEPTHPRAETCRLRNYTGVRKFYLLTTAKSCFDAACQCPKRQRNTNFDPEKKNVGKIILFFVLFKFCLLYTSRCV